MKKLIVLATLAALPAVAMADVTISGDLAVGIVNSKAEGKGSLTTENRTNGNIRFAGSDDLGNGLKAIWQIENRINLADTSGANSRDNVWAGRESFVGLTGGFGTLKMGTIYLMPTSGQMDFFENNSAACGGDGLWCSSIYDQGSRYNNMVSYQTPSFGGFTATVQHSFGNGTAKGETNTNEQNKMYSQAVSLAYQGQGFAVSYDGSRAKEDTQGNYLTLQEVNANATFGDLNLIAGYAHGKDEAAKASRNGWGLTAAYTIGNFVPMLGYWHEGAATGNNDSVNSYAAGVKYNLSKRTRAGVEYSRQSYHQSGMTETHATTVYLGTSF
ncbi:porin [Vogesella sp. LIG4]|uniref:porin n=1 Tax=Vogesella sp. LIG4 TaxID=1192162 RepID=UPI00081F7FEB|nr:porin [Vogesella sp. LIG4]SCK16701.1 major outer membrane protein P.IB [Vogesella sp. LIG4]